MKIYFCDLCNESVPQADLDEGRAFLRKGHVVCATCDRLMTGQAVPGAAGPFGRGDGETIVIEGAPATATLAPPTARALAEPAAATRAAGDPGAVHATGEPVTVRAAGEPVMGAGEHPRTDWPRRGGGSAAWLAIVTLIFAAGAFALLVERVTGLETKMHADGRDLSGEVRRAEARLDGSLAELAQREQELEARLAARIDGERARAEDALRELSAELAQSRLEVARLAEAAAGLQDGLERLRADGERRHADLAGRFDRAEEDLRYYSQRLTDLELTVLRPAAAAPGPDGTPAAGAPAWQALLADLASPAAGTRWQAVDALGQTRDPAVLAHVAPMLKDPDVFVRMAAARALGDLGSLDAVPALIDALEDPEAAVREASIVALKDMTGRDFRFDPLAVEAERAKRVKAWREWWEKEGQAGG